MHPILRRSIAMVFAAVLVPAAARGQEITGLEPIRRPVDDGWRPRLGPGEYLVPGSVRIVSATGQVTPMPDPPSPGKLMPAPGRIIPSTPMAASPQAPMTYAAPAPMASSCYSSSYQPQVYAPPAVLYEAPPRAAPGPGYYEVPAYAPQGRPIFALPGAAPRRRFGPRLAGRFDVGMRHRVDNQMSIGFGIGDGARSMSACGPWGCR